MLNRWLPLTGVPITILYALSLICFLLMFGLGAISGHHGYKREAQSYRLTGWSRPINSLLRTYLVSGLMLCTYVWFFWWWLFGVVWFWFGLACGLAASLVAIAIYLGKLVIGPLVVPLPKAFRLTPEAVQRPNIDAVTTIMAPIFPVCLLVLTQYPSFTLIVFPFQIGASCFLLYFTLRANKVEYEIAVKAAAAEFAAWQWQQHALTQSNPGALVAPLSA